MQRLSFTQALVGSALGSLLLLAGCSTTQMRIDERPGVYQALPAGDRALVTSGKIREGMSEDAVYIAWGAPNQRAAGRNRGRTVETWIYFGTTVGDHYSGSFLHGPYAGFGYGYGYGGGFGYGRGFRGGRLHRAFYYDPFYDPFFYNRTSVLRYPERTVTFQRGRVIAFQFLPAPRFF